MKLIQIQFYLKFWNAFSEGDSGSRHAMEAAKNYDIARYAMYNKATDIDDKQFGLNRDFIEHSWEKK